MSATWKTIIGLLLVLPLGGFVAGSLITSGAAEPERRAPIVIDERSGSPSDPATDGPSRTPSRTPSTRPTDRTDDGEDRGDDEGADGDDGG
ncbi:MAG: hypothetical protein JWN84_4295, partial [Nocardioides sp.]|nr:hypothetical protein [Nocardioides sp.]